MKHLTLGQVLQRTRVFWLPLDAQSFCFWTWASEDLVSLLYTLWIHFQMALNLLQKYQHPFSAQSGKSTEKAEMTKQLGHHEANLPEFFRGYSAAALRPSSASWGLRAVGEESWGGGWARQLHRSDVFFPVTTAQLSSSVCSLRSGCTEVWYQAGHWVFVQSVDQFLLFTGLGVLSL